MSEQHHPENDPNMNEYQQEKNRGKYSIYMIGGRKGGTGKSHNCRTLGEYIRRRNWMSETILVNCDPTFDDVSHVYDESKKIIFSDSKYRQKEPKEIFRLVSSQNVVVNLPANVETQFDKWILNKGILEDEMKELYYKVYYFYVSDGCYQSIRSFIEHVNLYKDKKQMQNLLVLNPARLTCDDSFIYLNGKEELINTLKDNQIPVLLCPELASDLQYFCDELGITYSDSQELQDNILEKQDLAMFLRKIEEYYGLIFGDTANKLSIEKIVKEQKTFLNNYLLPIPESEEYLELARGQVA